jgi:hypothetical protein
MNQISTQVPLTEGEAATTPAALTPTESVAQATPSAVNEDAESLAKIKAQLDKYEQDIRNLKSVSDKRVHEMTQDWQRRESELRKQNEELRLASMDEASREKYLQEVERQRLKDLETKAQEAARVQDDYGASLGAIKYYTSLGVPLTELVLDQGYDALFQSGFKYVTEQYKQAKENKTPPLPPQAPPVATVNGTVPNLKPTEEDLVKKYGSMEMVYRLVEQGRLDPAVIPV